MKNKVSLSQANSMCWNRREGKEKSW